MKNADGEIRQKAVFLLQYVFDKNNKMEYSVSMRLSCIILKQVNGLSELNLYGRTMLDWVKCALDDPITVLEYGDEDFPSILERVRAVTDIDSEYTVVLYSDTPLITKKTVFEALSHIFSTDANVIQLTRGLIFKTDYLIDCKKLVSPPHFYCEEEDFLTIDRLERVPLVADILRMRILSHLMQMGALIMDTNNTFIDCNVQIGKNITIMPFNTIKGDSVIGDNAQILEGNNIENSVIGKNCVVRQSTLSNVIVGDYTTVGPYAYLRQGTVVGANCRVGDFVEIKNSSIGDKSKIAHLAYIGDCDMGANCNIGCGVVTVNYDGKNKHRTVLGNSVFVGANCNLIAPIKLEDQCFVAAGSTLTDTVPKKALAIARSRQVNKLNWKKNKD